MTTFDKVSGQYQRNALVQQAAAEKLLAQAGAEHLPVAGVLQEGLLAADALDSHPLGQSRPAVALGMAECMPNLRAS